MGQDTDLGHIELRHDDGLVRHVEVHVRAGHALARLARLHLPQRHQRRHVALRVEQGACVCVCVVWVRTWIYWVGVYVTHIKHAARLRTGHGHLVYPERAALGVRLPGQLDVRAPGPLVLFCSGWSMHGEPALL